MLYIFDKDIFLCCLHIVNFRQRRLSMLFAYCKFRQKLILTKASISDEVSVLLFAHCKFQTKAHIFVVCIL